MTNSFFSVVNLFGHPWRPTARKVEVIEPLLLWLRTIMLL